jgi:hypothetical protein
VLMGREKKEKGEGPTRKVPVSHSHALCIVNAAPFFNSMG